MQSTEAIQVHKEILKQLGGNKFLVMTGSKNLLYSATENNFLSMKLTANKLKAQYLKITLDSTDTYTMEFTKVVKQYEKIGNIKFCVKETPVVLYSISGVYNDMLQSIFTKQTGLNTHL